MNRQLLVAPGVGNLTAVRTMLATPDERARALSAFEARDVLDRLCRDGASASLGGVLDMVACGGFGLQRSDPRDLISAAIARGELTLARGWPATKADLREARAPEAPDDDQPSGPGPRQARPRDPFDEQIVFKCAAVSKVIEGLLRYRVQNATDPSQMLEGDTPDDGETDRLTTLGAQPLTTFLRYVRFATDTPADEEGA